ncbi:antibiotic biosynthesis monooxygenase [Bordetella bronchialis]|uniref:Antibiotic biosynthesis monooxygenase n=1 Tax=Bordetella bronchialis TaxID=463025 RepID=A0A193FFP5_9BORD|nr:antibiotic biosynthesis monooxygenase [Bordetella bronchialis]ANN66088.1 antibiotic biosynthesis monooxygenase [Bordetella bronchialis]ANN71174.1 antibiotic biosynthesis monooxygenase [Bordetella bronchialis]
MSAPAVSTPAPVTMLITRHIAPERYSDFLAWLRQGEILAAGFPGFLGSGVLQPPEGGDQYQIVLRFHDEASLARWENSLPRRMWLERGRGLVRESQVHRATGMDAWFGPQKSAPPRWKQAFSIWVVYCPSLLLFNVLFQEQLASLSLFWRVVVTTSTMSPILSFFLIPFISRVLRGWLYPRARPRRVPARGMLKASR